VSVGAVQEYTFNNVTGPQRIEVEFELSGSPFDDVRENNWFYDAVVYVYGEGLMNGTSATHFSPGVTTTRGMFVTILGRMAGVRPQDFSHRGTVTGSLVNIRTGPSTAHAVITQVPQGTNVDIIGRTGDWYRIHHGGQTAYISRQHVSAQRGTFQDVTPGAFYAPYVEWANELGISEGTGGSHFAPGAVMTRQEMATLLHRYVTAMNIDLPQSDLPAFGDIDAVAPWARPAVTALQRAGVIQGTPGGNFNPLGSSDRASVATMIANFHQLHG